MRKFFVLFFSCSLFIVFASAKEPQYVDATGTKKFTWEKANDNTWRVQNNNTSTIEITYVIKTIRAFVATPYIIPGGALCHNGKISLQ